VERKPKTKRLLTKKLLVALLLLTFLVSLTVSFVEFKTIYANPSEQWVSDSFLDESKISGKDDVYVNTTGGYVRLADGETITDIQIANTGYPDAFTNPFVVTNDTLQTRHLFVFGSSPRHIFWYQSQDDGETWFLYQDITEDAFYPSATTDSNNNIYITYGNDTSRGFLYYRKFTYSEANGNWSIGSRETVETGTYILDSNLVVDSGGYVHVVWVERVDSTYYAYYKMKNATSGSWDASPTTIASSSTTYQVPEIRIDSYRNLHVIYSGPTLYEKIATWGGSSWSWGSADVISTVTDTYWVRFQCSIDYENTFWLSWADKSSSSNHGDLKVAKKSYGGSWSTYTIDTVDQHQFTGIYRLQNGTVYLIYDYYTGYKISYRTCEGTITSWSSATELLSTVLRPFVAISYAQNEVEFVYKRTYGMYFYSLTSIAATYKSSGALYSTNLLSGKSVQNIDQFNYTCTIPAQTTLEILFSQNNSTWVNSTGGTAWQSLSAGTNNTIDLSSLLWNGPYFYYKIAFANTDDSTPILDYIAVAYSSAGEDTQAPTYSNLGVNTTIAGALCKFYVKWTDNVGLSKFRFGTNNTGTWINDTWTSLSGNPAWANVTKTLNSTVGIKIAYRFWCNDTSNNLADTELEFLTTSSGSVTIEVYDSWISDTRLDYGSQVTIKFRLRYSNNATPCETGNAWVNGTSCAINSTGWITYTKTYSAVVKYTFTVTQVNVKGYTTFQMVTSDAEVIWDRLEVYDYGTSDNRADVNSPVDFWWKLRYDYDNVTFTNTKGNCSIGGAVAIWSATNNRWELSITLPSTSQSYSRSIAFTDTAYGLTVITGTTSQSVIADRIRIDYLGKTDTDGRVNMNSQGTFYATASLEYDGHTLGSGDSLVLGGYTFTWVSANNRFESAITQTSVSIITINSFTSGNEATYGITVGNINSKTANLIWDKLTVTFSTNNTSPSIGETVTISWTITRQYDSTTVTSFTIDISRDELKWLTLTNSSKNDVAYTDGTRIYTLYPTTVTDNTYGITVAQANSATVTWGTLTGILVTVPTNVYFGFSTGYYINFNVEKTFESVYRESGYWYFDGYGFKVQNANMTITNFGFSSNILVYNLTRPYGTSTSEIYVKDKGNPKSVTGATNWNYNPITKIITITASHASTVTITIVWGERVTFSTNIYFGLPQYGTYISFNTQKTFNDIYRKNSYWYFEGYGFQVQDANMTITDFFQIDIDILKFSVAKPSGTSISKIYVGDKGQPSSITGAASWSYDAPTKILTIYVSHSSTVNIEVQWRVAPPPPPPPPGIPSEILNFLQYLWAGDFFGFITAIYVSAFSSADIFFGILAMFIVIPIYIRTKSLLFLSIAWILLGTLFLVAMPLVSGIAVLFLVLGIGSTIYQLFMFSRSQT
jgi:hypothetical protein